MENVNCLRCRFRHKDNGNCTAVGGFCTAVPAAHCPLLREYLDGGQLMGKYITKEAALNTIFSEPPEAHYPSWYAERIKALPAADVAPVVRCKDCKWFVDNNGGEWYGCKMFQVVRITPEDAPKPDDFCSYGERKDGGADNG